MSEDHGVNLPQEGHDVSQIGVMAADFMEELQKFLPEGSEIVTAGIVCEVRFKCDNCPNFHTITPTKCTTQSQVHEEALFIEASECSGLPWVQIVSAEDDE